MTPQEAYRAALEAAAKTLENSLMPDRGYYYWVGGRPFLPVDNIRELAAAIRALPVPQDDGDMVLVPREQLSVIIPWAETYHGFNTKPGECVFCDAIDELRAMINAKE